MKSKKILFIIVGVIVLASLNILAIAFLDVGEIARETEGFLREFTLVLSVIQKNHFEEISSERLIHGAIRGMLKTLDPHTSFFDKERFRNMKMSQRGSYYGIGMAIAIRNERLTVISPLPGSPASILGIRAGDIIDMIDDESTKGIDMTTALLKLRGPKGTTVEITIIREGYSEPMKFTIERAEITFSSVSQAFFIEPGTGYIQLINFSETTSQELEKALDRLESQGMKRLLLDVRGNTGGLLVEAVEVADNFLSEGLIAYTKGRMRGSSQEFHAKKEGTHPLYPMIVLTDLGTASGAEIVTGAMQDHDRGLIVGQTTWGKGLVQTVFSLSYETGLAATTARYYTPSGRLIQRDYSRSFVDYFRGKNVLPQKERQIFKTDLGRVVYGGGGITPDVLVEDKPLSEFAQRLLSRNVFFDFATTFIGKADSEIGQDFEVDEEVMHEFEHYLRNHTIDYNTDDIASNLLFIKQQIKARVFSHLWGLEEGVKIVISGDEAVQKALTLWDEAEDLINRSSQLIHSETY